MKLLEDPIFKAKYMKNKLRVKRWESDFMEKYGRKPNKNDIKEADVSIKEAYKVYWKLKTSALEETLIDITFCDEMQDNVTNNLLQKSINSLDKIPNSEKSIKDTENIDPYNKCFTEIEGSFSQSNISTNVDGVWGDNLNKNKEQMRKQTLLIGKTSSFQLSKNKLEISSFSKRNPRKSLSLTKIRNKSENNTNLRINWMTTNSKDSFDTTTNEVKSIFGETMKLTFKESKPAIQYSINAVQQLAHDHMICVSRNLNEGWINRCMRENNLEINPLIQRFSGTSDFGVESTFTSQTESSIHFPKSSVTYSAAVFQVSDEDFICNSDSEEECRKKRIRNFKKQQSDQDDDHPTKRQCITIDSDFAFSQSNDIIDNDIFEQTCHVTCNTNSNLMFNNKHSKNTSDSNINSFNLTNNSNILNNSVKIENNIVSLSSNVELNIVNNKKTSENICQKLITETDQIKNRLRNTISKSINLTNLMEDSLLFDEKPVTQDMSLQKVKQVLFDSNLNCAEEKTKNTKTKISATRKHSIKRSISQQSKEKTMNNEKKYDERERRKSFKKESSLDKNNEPQNSETYEIPTYDMKILQTIPRFVIKPTETSAEKLIAQPSESFHIDAIKKDISIFSKTNTKLTAIEKLEKKIDTGTMNNNFIRINLKKKVFVRGKKNFNLFKYKRNQWKHKKKLASNKSSLNAADLIDKNNITCFKCGEFGHFAKRCTTFGNVALLPLNEIDESTNFPTLEEAEKMANENIKIVMKNHEIDWLSQGSLSKISQYKEKKEDMTKLFDDDFVSEKNTLIFQHKIPQELLTTLSPERKMVEPLYSVNKDGSLIKTPLEVFETLRIFGHESFKIGQEKAIMRILSGYSTLVMLSTGSGKSLCYQLPAYLYSQQFHCITLVISPLVSLMDDQIMSMPKVLSAACLHTNQTSKVREQMMQLVRDGKVNVLLVSPEAVVAGEKSIGFSALLKQLPPIAFACIDEVHCISQWSHNFRSSYLMICRVLKEKLRVKTILGLTATVTKTTAESIVKHLDLHDDMAGVISDIPLPSNLVLTVSKDENKDYALIALLKSDRFRKLDCMIVYCIRREECERIAALLRISLQDPRNPEKPKTKISTIVEVYHAGMTAHKRKIVQKKFMNGKIKIVVATVAFGMGINKSDIRAIIHYNMPGTFEEYVQEIGRSGRDSITAHCHLFLNSMQDSDKWELRKHIYANSVDRHTIRHLLQKIFIPCSCKKIKNGKCSGHEVALPIDETVQELDITQETISTLLCYLELHPKKFITVLSSVYVRARISSYNGLRALKQAAQSSPPLAMALHMQKEILHKNSNIIEFSVIEIASAIGWDSEIVKRHLKTLEWMTGIDGKTKRSTISVQYDKLGLRVKAPGNLTDTELDEALEALITRIHSHESLCLQQLEFLSCAFDKISVPTIKHCLTLDNDIMKRSEELKNIIREYFQSDFPLNSVDIDFQNKIVNEEHIIADVRNLIMRYKNTKFTGRAVARIFHGIQSPNYPALIWSKCCFWRAHIAVDFNIICKIAIKEILALR